MRAALLVLVAACGRYGFDATANADSPAITADADTSGLVAEWAMESVAGDVVPDLTGHGHDAVCSTAAMSCPTVTAGKHGNALRFDGVNDHLTVANAPDLETMTALTVTAWIWVDSVTAGQTGCFVNKPLGTGDANSWQSCMNGMQQVLFYSNTSIAAGVDGLYTNPNSLPLAAWVHIAIRWDGTFKTIWVNGLDLIGDPSTLTFDSNDIVIGYDMDFGAPSVPFTGIVDEVRIYNRALSDSEIALLAQ
jgi:hypothetical protein